MTEITTGSADATADVLRTRGRRWRTGVILLLGALLTTLAPAVTTSAQAASATRQVCQTQTAAGASVYTVCLTGSDSYNGSSAVGYVAGIYCNVYYPTGVGWACLTRAYGSYWNRSLGAWEDWLNFKLTYISPFLGYNVYYSNCVYLRIDTRPSGYTTYQNFANKNLSTSVTC